MEEVFNIALVEEISEFLELEGGEFGKILLIVKDVV
jgi:hypothetical protein